jgi:hypothetical protein
MQLASAFQDWPNFAHEPVVKKKKLSRREKAKAWNPAPKPTLHALKRLKQRLGLKGGEAQRQTERAFWSGVMAIDCYGDLGLWLEKVVRKHNCGNATRIWRHHAFIFENDVLVTVIPVPKYLL